MYWYVQKKSKHYFFFSIELPCSVEDGFGKMTPIHWNLSGKETVFQQFQGSLGGSEERKKKSLAVQWVL